MKLPELLKRMQAASKLKTTAATAASSNSPIELKFLDAETAYLNALTFEYDLEKYKLYSKMFFMQIKSAGVRNLIIDVRNNRGGTRHSATL
jgi:C-terminal processing protease CtpA/Prc